MEFRVVTVIGSGTMGRGIAYVALLAGLEVILYDIERPQLESAREAISALTRKGEQKGQLRGASAAEILDNLSLETDFEKGVIRADLIIEAIPENLSLKQALFKQLSERAAPHAILATNTSSLRVGDIAGSARHPGKVIGLHFFNPPYQIKLLEIIRHPRLDPATLEAATRFGALLQRELVIVSDSPGFASSRLGICLALEAIRMVETGVASPEDIDRAMEKGYGHPMGPLKLTDHVGLDVRLAIAEYLQRELGESFRPPELLIQMVREGRLGKKSGHGFYRYS